MKIAEIAKNITDERNGMNIPKGNGEPRTWRIARIDGQPIVKITCGCGIEGLLDHTIAEDGRVSPSVVCPKDCGFHEMVVLQEWNQAVFSRYKLSSFGIPVDTVGI